MDWTELIKYPQLMPGMNPKVKELLDTMQELIPINKNWSYDRVGIFLYWREKCYQSGIITFSEKQDIGQEMIHGCGGM